MHPSSIKRRALLRSSLLAGALALPRAYAQTTNALRWIQFDPDIGLVQAPHFNVLAYRGPEGVMMVDGGDAQHSAQTLALVRQHCGDLPQLLFNSHWHHTQIGCNAFLGENKATIIAHENTKLWLSTEVHSTWENQIYKPLPEFARPNRTFYYDQQSLRFNHWEIFYGYLPQAHTDGDMYVMLPEKNILYAGGVVAGDHYPIVDYCSNGWLGGMIESLQQLIDIADDDTRIIPARGPIRRKGDLKRQQQLCRELIVKIAQNYYSGLTYADFIRSLPLADTALYKNNPDQFLHTAYHGAWWHVRELRRYARG